MLRRYGPSATWRRSGLQSDVRINVTLLIYNQMKSITRVVNRFGKVKSIETFIVATPPPAPAPTPFNKPPFPDADTNPTTNPVQLYHLGLWFNNPQDAFNAGGPSTVTPFNGEHNAGVQILDTSNFPDDFGPLRHVTP